MAFEAITAKPLSPEVMLKALRGVAKKEADFANIQFALTYKSWSHKPSFAQGFKESSKEMEGFTLTSGDGSKNNPYPFVTKGTSVRYATMTPDFSPKSKVRTIGSGGGSGGVLYVDKRRPRPGIQAREFEEEIALREQPKFQKRGQVALDNAAKKSGHSI
jgi:hypothetical protein